MVTVKPDLLAGVDRRGVGNLLDVDVGAADLGRRRVLIGPVVGRGDTAAASSYSPQLAAVVLLTTWTLVLELAARVVGA